MSRNGSGVYSLPAGNPVVTGTTISSSWANTTLSDIATALTGSVASDGQTAMTGNLQMGNNKVTGLAVATTSGDALSYAQAATVSDLAVTGNATVGGTLTLTGGLTLNGNVTVGDSSSDTLTVNATSTFAAGATFSSTFAANGGVTLGDASGDALTINSSAVSIPNGLNFDSNTFVIDATNNLVGIGTNSPNSFVASGKTLVIGTGSGDNGMTIYAGNTSKSSIYFADGTTGSEQYRGWFEYNHSSDYLSIGTAVNERIRITNTGAIGIGTSSPDAKLHVASTVTSTTFTTPIAIFAGTSYTGGGIYGIGFHYSDVGTAVTPVGLGYVPTSGTSDTKGALAFYTRDTTGLGDVASERMRIDSSGNVGIGTSSPAGKLVVSNGSSGTTVNAQADDFIVDSSSDVGISILSPDANGSRLVFGSPSDSLAAQLNWDYTNKSLYVGTATATGKLLLITGNAATVATLDSTGNLGLGVTPSAWSSLGSGSGGAFQTYSGAILSTPGGGIGTTTYVTNAYYNGTNWIYRASNASARYDQWSNEHRWLTAPSGTAGTAITFTQAMTLDASGRLLLGNTSSITSSLGSANMQISGATQGAGSTQNLVFNTSASGPVLELGLSKNATVGSQTIVASGNNLGSIRFSGSDGTAFIRAAQIAGEVDGTPGTNDMPGRLVFLTTADGASSPTERMRIDSSGNLLVGTTSQVASARFSLNRSDAGVVAGFRTVTASGTVTMLGFLDGDSVTCGTITIDTSANTAAYNTSSDARLKNDIGVATDTSVIDNTIIHDFSWKSNGSIDRGVFAQEAQLVKPSAVSVGTDEVNEDGNLVSPWGVDYSKYVPDLIVHAQQLKNMVQELKAEVDSLKAQLNK